MEKLKIFFWYLTIPLIIFVFFKNLLENLFSIFIVNPIFSKIKPSFWLYDLLIVILITLFSIVNYKKIKNGARIPTKWIAIFITYLIIYVWYRYSNHPFSFSHITLSKDIKLLDIVNSIPFFILLLFLGEKMISSFKRKLNLKTNESSKVVQAEDFNFYGFAVDEPTIITKKEDLLSRMKFIEILSQLIINTESKNGSFPIGVVAPWGSGKTTFIRSLKLNLQKDVIVFELDVWICKSADQIVKSFFEQLKQNLKSFSFTINNKIEDYSKSLVNKSGNIFIDNLLGVFQPEKTVEQEYIRLKREIESIDRKIVVIIDDIDRLDKKEIYEVIKLIRNTANFGNIFFIVAYDRNYILNAIHSINSHSPNTFLEKIFQLEFTLPPTGDQPLKIAIKKLMDSMLVTEDKETFLNFYKTNLYYGFDKVDLTFSFISNMRDVIRFVNSFKVSYHLVKGNVDFEDFYNLQLIKFKYPDIYVDFYKNKTIFIRQDERGNYHPKRIFYGLIQTPIDKIKNIQSELALKVYLQNRRDIYKINEYEINTLTISFSKIFPIHSIYISEKPRFLSVIQPSMFDRYFYMGLEGQFNLVDFSKARNLSLESFIEQITIWGQDANVKDDLKKYILEIEDFDDVTDFEKIVRTIFSLGKVTTLDWTYFQKILLSENNKIINLYYENDLNKFKNFILGLLKNAESPFLFESNLIKFLDDHYYNPGLYVITQEELNNFSTTFLKIYTSKINQIDSVLWKLFWNCKRSKFKEGNRSNELPKEAKEIMINFILTKDLDNYLIANVDNEIFENKFRISASVLKLFDSWENFEIILNNQDENKWNFLKEFKLFFVEVKKLGFSIYVDFKFKTIKPNLSKVLKL